MGPRMFLSRLLDPAVLLLAALVASLAAARPSHDAPSRARRGWRAAALVTAALWLSMTPAVSHGLARIVEVARPDVDVAALADRDDVALVVLGSSVDPPHDGLPPRERLDTAGTARALGAVRWFRALRPRAVILSGRVGGTSPDASARAMADLLTAAGVPADRLWFETASRNTRENAARSVALGRARGIRRFVVVTSALHMRRGLAEFRRAGVTPLAAPVDVEDPRFQGVGAMLPTGYGLGHLHAVTHEILGHFRP